jgi:hypothetical protein
MVIVSHPVLIVGGTLVHRLCAVTALVIGKVIAIVRSLDRHCVAERLCCTNTDPLH